MARARQAMGRLPVSSSAMVKPTVAAAQALRPPREPQLVVLLKAPLVHVGQRVDDAEGEDALADGEHLARVAAHDAPQPARRGHERARRDALDLVGAEGVHLVHVRHLVGADPVHTDELQQVGDHEGHGEATGGLGPDDGEQREEHAPQCQARTVEEVVAPGVVRRIARRLVGERAGVHGAYQTVPPVTHQAARITDVAERVSHGTPWRAGDIMGGAATGGPRHSAAGRARCPCRRCAAAPP